MLKRLQQQQHPTDSAAAAHHGEATEKKNIFHPLEKTEKLYSPARLHNNPMWNFCEVFELKMFVLRV